MGRLGSLALLGWKAYRQFAPFLARRRILRSKAADKTIVLFRHLVHVTAHLAGPSTGNVAIYARPYDGVRKQLSSGPVDVKGNRSAAYLMHRRTRLRQGAVRDKKRAVAESIRPQEAETGGI